MPESVVRRKGSDREATYVSATELTASMPASDGATAGIAEVIVISC